MEARKAVKAACKIKEAIELLEQVKGYEDLANALKWKVAVIERREFDKKPEYASGINILK